MYGIGAVLGTLVGTVLGQGVGRRAALMMLSLPDILAWVIAALANNILMIKTSRFLAGLAAGGYSLCIQIYVGEIASVHNRGWLLALTSPITALGILSMYVTSNVLPWHCAAAASAPVPALMMVSLLFYWDSPYWYSHNNNPEAAREALIQFRGSPGSSSVSISGPVSSSSSSSDFVLDSETEAEFGIIMRQLGGRLSFKRALAAITETKRAFKPFLILNSLFLLVMMCGKFAIDYYAVQVFLHFGSSSMTEYLAGMIAAVLTFIGTLFLVIMVRFTQRKTVLLISASVVLLSMTFLGLCSYSHTNGIWLLKDCDWLPITCVVSYIMASNMGLTALPYIFISEFYSPQTRCVWGGLTLTLHHLELVLAEALMPSLETIISHATLFWFFAIVVLCVIFFTCYYVPETKNRDLASIEFKFSKLGKVSRASPWITPCPSPSASSVRKLHFKSHLFTQ